LNAAIEGNLEDIKRLLEQGADTNARDNDGMTALMYAEDLGYTEIVDLLKAACAQE
jgi:ankyrin repeat protein